MATVYRSLEALTLSPTTIPEVSKAEKNRIDAEYKSLIKEEQKISKTAPNYYHPEKRVSVIGVVIPEGLVQLKEPARTTDWSDRKYQGLIQVARFPFAMGGVRAAYHGRIKLDTKEEWTNVIVKEFMFPQHRSEKQYISQSENSAWAKSLMDQYRTRETMSKHVDVIPSRVIKVFCDGGSETLYNMEECLHGSDFRKWTTNGGVILNVNKDLLKFSAWTYEYTSKYAIVTDIQGVESSTGIKITDPAMLCVDIKRFGPTNLGPPTTDVCYQAAKNGASPPSAVDYPHSRRTDGISLYPTVDEYRDMRRMEDERRRAEFERHEVLRRAAAEKRAEVKRAAAMPKSASGAQACPRHQDPYGIKTPVGYCSDCDRLRRGS